MKKTKVSTHRTKKVSNQQGFVKPWRTGSKANRNRKTVLVLFVLGFAIIGSYIIITSMAAAKPRYFGNTDYWMGRVRACESGKSTWGQSDYKQRGGAYGYNEDQWDDFAGVEKADQASPAQQDAKFIADWNNSRVGSNPWKDTEDCWKPGGTISGAPCLPIPKNPLPSDTPTTQNTDNSSDPSEEPETVDEPEIDNPDESE